MREYLSYLLRLWRVSDEGGPAWRRSLQRPGSDVAVGFPSLEELLQFLREETDAKETEGDRI